MMFPEINVYWIPKFPEIVLHVLFFPKNIPHRSPQFLSYFGFILACYIGKRLPCHYF